MYALLFCSKQVLMGDLFNTGGESVSVNLWLYAHVWYKKVLHLVASSYCHGILFWFILDALKLALLHVMHKYMLNCYIYLSLVLHLHVWYSLCLCRAG